MPRVYADRAMSKTSVTEEGQATIAGKNRMAFAYITALFFVWGFITSLNDILIPHLKGLFALSYAQAMLVQSAFFSAYFFFAIPSGRIVRHFGYPQGISLGLVIAGIGAVLFLHAGVLSSYPVFLTALFVLACGVTLLQVAANPYASALGPEDTASARLNFVQAFNSLGATLAPWVGSSLILSQAGAASASASDSWQTFIPYLGIAGILFTLALVLKKLKLPAYTDASFSTDDADMSQKRSIWSHRPLLLGIIAIFCYVGAEVSIGSFLVNYMVNSWDMAAEHAGRYVSLYWGGAMIGRFVGTYFLKAYPPATCLKVVCGITLLLVGGAILAPPLLSPALLLAVGLFNAVMFPVIFSLSIRGLGFHTSQGASYLCMAIVGGAIMPVIQGALADAFDNLQLSFLLPLCAYAYIFLFAQKMKTLPPETTKQPA